MKSRCRRSTILVLAVMAASLAATTAALAAAPLWMPGFPLRAGTAVILMWTPVPGATEYKLLKQVGGGGFKEVYKGPANTFNDTDAPATKTIDYKVVPVSGGKDGDVSPVATLKGVEPVKPPTFTGTLPSPTAITLRWSNPAGTMFFNLYRAESKGGQYTLLGSVQQDSYTDRTVKPGKTYYYAVSSVDRNNTESEKSAPLEARLVAEEKVVEEKVVIKTPVPRGTFAGEDLYELDQPYDIGFSASGELFVMDRVGFQFFERDGKYVHRANFEKEWTAPAASVAVARDGAFLVAFNRDRMLRKLDASTGKLIWQKTYPPSPEKPDIVNNPASIVVDKEGNVWICDSARFQVIKMDPAFEKVLGTVGRAAGTYGANDAKETDLPGITKIAYNPNDNKIYAMIAISGQIKVIDAATLKVEKTFGGVGPRPGQFQGLGGMAFKKDGNILIFDPMSQVVKEFSKNHEYVATLANVFEKGLSKLSSTFGTRLAYREETGRFYISSTLANVVYIFDMPK